MALCETRGLDARQRASDANALDAPQVLCATIYRCASCGSEIPFDALMVTCRCIDDAGASPTRAALASAACQAVLKCVPTCERSGAQ